MTNQTVSQAVAERDQGVISIIKANQTRIAPVLPDHIDVDTFVGLATGALFRDPKLMQAAQNNPGALMNALMRCAALGHQPGTDEFYLIPRKKGGRPEIQGIEGYRGIVERMYRSGAVASVKVREVCENDSFDFDEGIHDRPVHKVKWFGGGRGEMIGVYAYAVLTTGAVSRVVVLDKADVMAAKDSGDGSDSQYSPWNRLDAGKDRPEFRGRSMWWKTGARRLEPWVPTSAQYRMELARAAAEAHRVSQTDEYRVTQPVEPNPEPVGVLDGEFDEWPEPAQPGTGTPDEQP